MNNILKICFRQSEWKLIFILHIITAVSSSNNTSINVTRYGNNDVCLTETCHAHAAQIINFMNMTADPCEDFYEFTCGNFVKRAAIPDDQADISMFSILNNKIKSQLKTLFEEPVKQDEPRYSILVKSYYRTCLNRRRIEDRQLEPIKRILNTVIGGWPVIRRQYWNSRRFNWQLATKRCAKIGCIHTAFISMYVSTDRRRNFKNLLEITAASTALGHSSISDDNRKMIHAYFDYMVKVAILFGANELTVRKELWQALEFEIKLEESMSLVEVEDDIYYQNLMTVEEMQKLYPSIRWLQLINGVLQPIDKLRYNDTVNIANPKYMTIFPKLFRNTSKRTMANYMGWRIILDLIPFLDRTMLAEQFKYQRVLEGIKKKQERWAVCVETMQSKLNTAVSAMYVQNHFSKTSKNKTMELVKNIREQFSITLKQLDWMDQRTRESALDKIIAMSQITAYPDKLFNNTIIDMYYRNLKIDNHKYLESTLNIIVFNRRSNLYELRVLADKTMWKSFPATVINVHYINKLNKILLPAAHLHGVFFNTHRPNYMNFGSIGFLIGHELVHGFDQTGRQFDQYGNLVTWWKPEIQKAFRTKIQCIIDQYGNYTIDKINEKLNGTITQSENIADNGGIKHSYYAYKKWVQQNGPEPKLPDLPYTPEQMFWISAANSRCERVRLEYLENVYKNNENTPAKYRILGAFSNQNEFAKDFNCAIGSPMNPRKKCQIW